MTTVDPSLDGHREGKTASWVPIATIDINPDTSSFLADHSVGGVPLLPTALQLDLVCAALRRQAGGSTGVALRDVTVGTPVRCTHARTLVVQTHAAPGHTDRPIALVGADGGGLHLSAASARTGAAAHDPGPAAGPSVNAPGWLPGTAELVYPPLFHGRAFQVIGRFGRHGDALVATPARDVPGWDLAGQGGGSPARLLELLLQACGVWELAATGRMMRPYALARVAVSPPPSDDDWVDELGAHVVVRAYGGQQQRSFDGVAVDAAGRIVLRVTGYRPVELDLPVDPTAVSRIQHALAAHDPVPAPRPPRGVT